MAVRRFYYDQPNTQFVISHRLSGQTPTLNPHLTTKLYVDTLIAGVAWAAVDVIYVGKHGNDLNTGASIADAVLTITQAVVLATALGPAAGNIIVIEIIDGGTYTENIVLPSYVILQGNDATLNGSYTLADESHILVRRMVLGSAIAAVAILKSAGTGHCHVWIEELILTGNAIGIICTSGTIIFECQHLQVEDGFGVGSTTTDEIRVRINCLDITGTGTGIATGAAGEIDAVINCMEDAGAGTGFAILAAAGEIIASVGQLICNTAYSVAEGGRLELIVTHMEGTETGVAAVSSPTRPAHWIPLIPTVDFVTTAPGISTLTMSVDWTATILPGMAVRFSIGATDYYGVVTAMAANLMTIAGAPFTLGAGDIDEVWFSPDPSMVQQLEFFIQGNFDDGADATLLENDQETFFDWNQRACYVVQIRIRADSADSGANQARINLRTGAAGNPVCTANGNAGRAISAGIWVSSVTDINTTNYAVSRDDNWEISTDGNGSNSDGADLTISIVVVFP